MNEIVFWLPVIAVSVASVTDLRTRRIPNWLVLPFLSLGVATAGLSHGLQGMTQSLLGVLTGVLVTGVFCYLGGMGMGDLKLCAAVGAWLGPSQLFIALVITGLAGGVMAVCWAAAGGYLKETLSGVSGLISGFSRKGLRPHETLVLSNPLSRRMPYAPAIALGTILSFLSRHA